MWKVCYFVRMRIMIVVGRWNCLLFACKLGFFLKSVEVANGCGPFVRFVCWCGPRSVFQCLFFIQVLGSTGCVLLFVFLWWSLMSSLRFWLLFLFSCGVVWLMPFLFMFWASFLFMFFIYWIHIFSGFNSIKEFCSLIIVIFCRPTEEQTVRLKIHHGGMFIYQPLTVYINGQIEEEEWGWNMDTMSYIDFKESKRNWEHMLLGHSWHNY